MGEIQDWSHELRLGRMDTQTGTSSIIVHMDKHRYMIHALQYI